MKIADAMVCGSCGQEHFGEEIPAGRPVECRRCGHSLARPASGREKTVAWALTAFFLFTSSLLLPFVTAAKFGQRHDGYLLSGMVELRHQGEWVLALLVAGCGLVAPGLLLTLIFALTRRPHEGHGERTQWRRWAERIEQWSMPDVQLLAVLVAFLKLSALVEAAPAAGLWCYGAATLFLLLAWRSLGVVPRVPSARPRGLTAACSFSAVLLLAPAYLLPVMAMERLGGGHADTLFTSVAKLWHAGFWGIALIVFTASLLVPLLKLLGLGVLLVSDRGWRLGTPAQLTRLHHLVHAVGRWSMLDVFLVAFLCGIVQFDSLATVQAGPGLLAFAGAVVMTMIASSTFDSRSLWSPPGPNPSSK